MIRIILLVVVSLFSLALAGCANETRECILRGDSCIVSNNFCDAVTHYRKALSLSPERAKDQKFDTNFQYAKKECAKSHVRAGAELAAVKQLDEAAREFKTALAVDPDNKKAQEALEQTLNIKADNLLSAVDTYQDGVAAAGRKEWRSAVNLFQNALVINPNHTEAQEQINRALREIAQADVLYRAALPLLENRKWNAAVTELGKVLALDPAHPDAPARLSTARAEIAAGQDAFLKGESALKQGSREEAAGFFNAALRHDPGQSAARSAIADLYFRFAGEQEEKGNTGSAVLFYTKALSFLPDHKDAAARVTPLEEKLRLRISCNLGLLPFREYSRDPELSNSLYAALRKRLQADDKGFVKILDNKPFEKLAEDNDIPLEKLSDGKNIQLVKSLTGVSAVLTGKISAFKISSEKKSENLTKRYQSGTNRVRNPAYDTAVANARLASQAAESTRQMAAKAGFGLLGNMLSAATDVSTSIDVANTPEYIDEPVFGTWRYRIHHHRKKADVSAVFRLVDVQTGAVLVDESIPANVEFSADSVENPNPEIGIEDKPLPFDSDDELKTALIAKAAEQMTGTLSVTLQKYAARFLVAAKECENRNDRVQAVENYMNFFYAVPAESTVYANELKHVRDYLESVDIHNQM